MMDALNIEPVEMPICSNAASASSWSEERIETLKKLWADGKSASEIAYELGGITRSSVLGKVHRLGLQARSNHAVSGPKNRTPLVQKLWIDGYTAAQIAAKLGMAKASVYKKLKLIKAEPDRDYWPRERKKRIVKIRHGNHKYRHNQISFIDALPLPSELPAEAIPLTQRKTLMELEDHHCRWIYGDPQQSDMFFCGADKASWSSYCPFHRRQAANWTQAEKYRP